MDFKWLNFALVLADKKIETVFVCVVVNTTKKMTDAYQIALQALRTFMRKEREENGVFEAGGTVMAATTMCVRADGTFDVIPLDILSDPVNLKNMWCATTNSVAILFREWIYDWVVLIPRDDTLRVWDLSAMPGRDHDMYRARALAEHAIQNDFKISDAQVHVK